MRSTATKSVSRLVLAVLLLGLAAWSRPSSAQPGSTEVDWCAECAAAWSCIPCCRCDGGTASSCKVQCLP
jgi:hypothetical protein